MRDAVGQIKLTAAWWGGYTDAPTSRAADRSGDYVVGDFDLTTLRGGDQLPEFCWDEGHSFAWGTRVYPDSLIIAAAPTIYKRLSADRRIDTVGLIPTRDVLPVSGGD
nr:hypothetical protein [Microbacterium lemovicicum]